MQKDSEATLVLTSEALSASSMSTPSVPIGSIADSTLPAFWKEETDGEEEAAVAEVAPTASSGRKVERVNARQLVPEMGSRKGCV